MENASNEHSSINSDLSVKLYNHTSTFFENDNMFLSPLSIEIVLAMVSQGAANDTAEKFLTFFKAKNNEAVADKYRLVLQNTADVENITLNMANRIYIMDSFILKANFEKIINEYFVSEVTSVDFSQNKKVADEINEFVEEKTNNKINNLISPDQLNGNTRVVLVNAIYLKGNWDNPFDREETEEDLFYTSEDDGVYCQMMHKKDDFNFCWHHSELDASIVELHYLGKNASMVIILPNEIMGITEVEKQLAEIDLLNLTNDLSPEMVDLYLPKFKIETSIDLQPVLEKLGLGTIFEPEADLSETVENCENLYVSKVIHKAFLEVNEEGCEAAAATAALEMFMSGPTEFRAEHPFIFYLKTCGTDNDTILFMGKQCYRRASEHFIPCVTDLFGFAFRIDVNCQLPQKQQLFESVSVAMKTTKSQSC